MKKSASGLRQIVALLLLATFTGCTPAQSGREPSSSGPTGPAPHEIFAARPLHRPPALTGTGGAAKDSVRAFVAWASSSTPEEREDGRRVIEQARTNPDVAQALIGEFNASRGADPSRALVILAIIGELRSPTGEAFLSRVVREPLPTGERPTAEGDLPRTHIAEMLQAKAVQGLAYAGTPRSEELVLEVAGKHQSRVVRAEAIGSYLWNHREAEASALARKRLLAVVRPDERIFIDRVRREPAETARSFNPKLAAYLAAHPDLRPPPPRQQVTRPTPRDEGRKSGSEPPAW